MSKLEKTLLSMLIIAIVVLAGLLALLYQIKWRQPMGPSLQKPIPTPFGLPPTWTPDSTSAGTPLSMFAPDPAQNAISVHDPLTRTIGKCGGLSPMFIVVIGSDTRANSYLYGLADVIRLVRVDFVNPQVTVLEIPRDLWVEIPDIADNLKGQDHEKLNQAYLYGNPGFGYSNDPAGGSGLLTRTLALNFGTQIDHYVAVNMRTFEKIVNAVEGIDVTLPQTVDGRTSDDPDERLFFPQGTNHLNGVQALTLARIRFNGVFSRADNQDRVLCALRNKLTSPGVVHNIPRLIQSFQDAVQTSLSPEELSQIACLSTQVEPQKIILTSFPQELFEQDRIYDPVFKKSVFIWKVDYDNLREYIQRFNSGTWPSIGSEYSGHQERETHICQ